MTAAVIFTRGLLGMVIVNTCLGAICDFENEGECSSWNYSSPFLISNSSVISLILQGSGDMDVVRSHLMVAGEKLLLAECPVNGSQAVVLESSWFNTSAASCSLSFDLFVIDEKLLESVEMVLQRSSTIRDHVLWTVADEARSSVLEWQRYHVMLGGLTEAFRVVMDVTCSDKKASASKVPILALDNLHFKDCFPGAMQNNTCRDEELSCEPTRTCLDADALCDYTNDCPNAIDETSVCEAFPQGSQCDFESSMCDWRSSNPSYHADIWSRIQGRSMSKPLSGIGDHTTGSAAGSFVVLRLPEAAKSNIEVDFRSPMLRKIPPHYNSTAGTCKIRFYYLSSGLSENSVILTANDASHAGHSEVLWKLRAQKEKSNGLKGPWKRVSTTIPNFRSQYFVRFIGVPGHRSGTFAIDDISFSRPCFFGTLRDRRPSTASVAELHDGPFVGPPGGFEESVEVTSCDKQGPAGPTDLDCANRSSTSVGVVPADASETPGLQKWSVAVTGFYNVTAAGASGGCPGVPNSGCHGAHVSGIFRFHAGETIFLVVGQQGLCACLASMDTSCNGSGNPGGGGSLVYKVQHRDGKVVPLLVAGGGPGHGPTQQGVCSIRTLSNFDSIREVSHSGANDSRGGGESFTTMIADRNFGGKLPPAGSEGQTLCASGISSRPGGFGGGGAACGNFGGDGGGFYGKGSQPSTNASPRISGTSGINFDYALAGNTWLEGSSTGKVTISIICNCSIECRIHESHEYVCPATDSSSVPMQPETEIPFLYYIAAAVFVVALVGIVICLYLGTRKGAAKCIQRQAGILSCVTDTSQSTRSDSQLQRINDSHTEINQLYEINIVRNFDQLREIPKDKIQLKRALGQGAFGIVYQGYLKTETGTTPIAVKTSPNGFSSDTEVDFAAEAVIISQFHHPNIVQCFGVSFQHSPKYIVLELLSGGDVRSFLRMVRNSKKISVTMLELLEICADVAKGCQYLEQHHFIHRDVAARNCLLTTIDRSRVVKIADFGMARDVVRSEYYRRNTTVLLPVKWMPPEAVREGIFSSKSDIWAFGVLLWEVFSLGCTPYTGLSNTEVITYVCSGGRLNLPSNHCPTEIYDLMRDCWAKSPSERKSFSAIIQNLLGFMGVTSIVSALVPDEDTPPLPLETSTSVTSPVPIMPSLMEMTSDLSGNSGQTTTSVESQDHFSDGIDCHSGSKLLPANPSGR